MYQINPIFFFWETAQERGFFFYKNCSQCVPIILLNVFPIALHFVPYANPKHFPLETYTCEANIIGACLFKILKGSNIKKSLKNKQVQL